MKKNGFTLVETLVAIAIITLAILAPFTAVESVVSASRIAKDSLIANALAQEALEYVRFIRDNNYLAHQSDPNYASYLLDGLTSCTGSNTCTVDGTVDPSVAIAQCAGGGCLPLNINTNSGFYTQQASSNTTATIYTRYISMVQHAGYETATVVVVWNDHGAQSITITENFYDWF